MSIYKQPNAGMKDIQRIVRSKPQNKIVEKQPRPAKPSKEPAFLPIRGA